MNTIINTTGASSSTKRYDLSCHQLPFSMDCSRFLNWTEGRLESAHEIAEVYRSLVATVKFQPALDDSLEAKAMKFLESLIPRARLSPSAFLSNFASFSDDSVSDIVQSIVVLISSANLAITTATMEMFKRLIVNCSKKLLLALVKADIIPQVIIPLNLLSISFVQAVDLHINVLDIINTSLKLTIPNILARLGIEDSKEQEAVQETVLQQVIAPSEKYIWHLCLNRHSIVNRGLSDEFMRLLTWLIEIYQYHQRAMNFVQNMPSPFIVLMLSFSAILALLRNGMPRSMVTIGEKGPNNQNASSSPSAHSSSLSPSKRTAKTRNEAEHAILLHMMPLFRLRQSECIEGLQQALRQMVWRRRDCSVATRIAAMHSTEQTVPEWLFRGRMMLTIASHTQKSANQLLVTNVAVASDSTSARHEQLP
ncbi:hypothetical protein BLNAU_12376 [Blattamonas nauphoetae]|uniref:Uncharacterized protein n=1 Tax=Blattamonas nauphoetae TaxID=2049346 RepID=A0ABQ9XMU5_9EUKA|nr:hypothetical protein BLNAU_12376 [Blattamonas nauphoetae]